MTPPKIKPREREAIIQSLRTGVVPRIGLQHIQVGRLEEVKAVIADLERIADDAAAVRFVIGRFGSGKSFFQPGARNWIRKAFRCGAGGHHH